MRAIIIGACRGQRLMPTTAENPKDSGLSAATAWLERYEHRSQHPPDDAEKVLARNGQVTRIHRAIPTDEAYGEYTGIAKFPAAGAAQLIERYHRAKQTHASKP